MSAWEIGTGKRTELPETHQTGMVDILNVDEIKSQDLQSADFGIQISQDGRVWVCINGIALIRFKPTREKK